MFPRACPQPDDVVQVRPGVTLDGEHDIGGMLCIVIDRKDDDQLLLSHTRDHNFMLHAAHVMVKCRPSKRDHVR